MSGSTPETDFGARLRQAREARGISLRQIAASTKISLVALEGLERNEISKLPGGIFSRAFVRSYAQEVGLDPEKMVQEFLAAFDEETVTVGTPPALRPQKDTGETAFESRQRMASTVLKLVLVSLPLGALLLYFSTRGGTPAPPEQPPERPPAARPRPASERAAGAPAVPEATRPPADTGVEAPAPGAVPRAESPDPLVAPGNGSIRLEVAPTGTCWVSLTVDGTLVVAREMAAGERVVRRVAVEAVVQVGDAGAFAFSVNGRPGRPVGGSGQVRTIRITPANFESLLR